MGEDAASREEHNQLAVRAKTDEAAFTQLYHLYIKEIYGFVFRRVGHRETAEDLVSDIFHKMLAHLPNYNPNKAGFRTWLYRIANTMLIDHYRVHHNPNRPGLVHLDEEREEDAAEPALDHGPQKEISLAVRQSVATLPPRDRQIVEMRYFEGFSNQEIAEILDLSANHVGVLLYRSLQQLKQRLSGANISV